MSGLKNLGCYYKQQKFEICKLREFVDCIDNRLDKMYKLGCASTNKKQATCCHLKPVRKCSERSQDTISEPKYQPNPVLLHKRKKIHEYLTLDGQVVCEREKPLMETKKNPGNVCQAVHGNVALCLCCHNVD